MHFIILGYILVKKLHYSARDWITQPSYLDKAYKSTEHRGPRQPLVPISQTLSEITGPIFGRNSIHPLDNDLTKNGITTGEDPIGERIVVSGRVLDEKGRAQPNTLIEVWQCNSSGRYIHSGDQHNAPLDPNFFGSGRCITDDQGSYKFYTIKPGAYPWGNHKNAWRPAHIHFSLFGPAFVTRLITQSYFPGDPLLELDPIFLATPANSRNLLVKKFDIETTEEGFALGYKFDFVLRGSRSTPLEFG